MKSKIYLLWFLISISLNHTAYSVPPPIIKEPKIPSVTPPKKPMTTAARKIVEEPVIPYVIIIEKNGMAEAGYIKYKIEGENNLIALPIDYLKGKKLIPNTRYVLKVRDIEINNQTYLEFVEQIEPKVQTPGDIPPTLFYDCEGKEERIATYNELIYTKYYINSDNSIDVRPVNYHTTEFYKFTGKICGFTFNEDHKYTLEVKNDGKNYELVNILCDQEMNYIPLSKRGKINYTCTGNFIEDTDNDSQKNKPDYQLPVQEITNLDNKIWYLRYLFQTDSLEPINDLNNTAYVINIDSKFNKLKIETPCGFFYDKVTVDQNKFLYETRTFSFKKCDTLTELLLKQFKAVTQYEIKNDKLILSTKYDNNSQKNLIILEGFPKK